jgi:hypothetical protein
MHNNAYSLWRVNGCQQGFRSVVKFVSGGQESASKTATNHMQTVMHQKINSNEMVN